MGKRNNNPTRGNDNPAELCKRIERLGATGMDYRRIFSDFLDLTALCLDSLPYQWNGAVEYARSGTPIRMPDELEARYARIMAPYEHHAWAMPLFVEMVMLALDVTTDQAGELKYTDVFGDVYMRMISHGQNGEYYTPWNIAKAMAQMTMGFVETELRTRLLDAAKHSRVVKLAEMTNADITKWQTETLVALYARDENMQRAFQRINVLDPACGSGVMLLAAASCCPRWALDWCMIEFWGVDLSEMAVKMAQLNIRLYGLNGWNYRLVPVTEESQPAPRVTPLALPERINVMDGLQLQLPKDLIQLPMFAEAQ